MKLADRGDLVRHRDYPAVGRVVGRKDDGRPIVKWFGGGTTPHEGFALEVVGVAALSRQAQYMLRWLEQRGELGLLVVGLRDRKAVKELENAGLVKLRTEVDRGDSFRGRIFPVDNPRST